MTSEQLKNIRISQGLTQGELAALLQTPPRTYQDWESGKGRIPGIMAATLGLLLERDERITRMILDNAAARIAHEFPAGIPSQVDEEE